jgi:hypothetical protein
MFLSKWKFLIAAFLFLPFQASAAGQNDQQSYCTYVMEQAQAQRDLLRTPIAVAGFTQPDTGLPMQVVGGATLNLSDVRKAGLTMDAARKNCELYKASTEAQQEVQYAMASLEREALNNRLNLIDQALKSLDALMEKTSKMVEAQNATRLMLFSLQTTKIKLNADRADTQAKISAIYVPALGWEPLKELATEKQRGESDEQRAQDKVNRQNEWNVILTVGAHQQVNPIAFGVQPYGEVTVNYNFASWAIDKHLNRAEKAHDEWKTVQESDVARSVVVLQQQIIQSVTVQEAKLKSLQEESKEIARNLQIVQDPDTSAAFDFQNQLTAAQLLLNIEAGDSTFRIGNLRDFLAKNY